MPFKINLGSWGSIFAVPSQVVDNDIKLASAYQLKVLLYLLRHSGEELTYEQIGNELSIHSADVKDSVLFWVQRGLIAEGDAEFLPAKNSVNSTNIKQTATVTPQANVTDTTINTVNTSVSETTHIKNLPLTRPSRPSIQFVSQRLNENTGLSYLMNEIQSALQKPLSSGDICTIYMLFDTYGLPPEIILMLVQYCVSMDKRNMSFIEKEGIIWSNDGIITIEQAEVKITELKNRYSAWGIVSTTFGIKTAGSPTKVQLDFANCWLYEWKFNTDMLREAYERCVNQKSICDLKYINGILKRWNASGIHTIADLQNDTPKANNKKPQNSSKSKGNNFENNSFNVDDLDNSSFFDH